MASLFDFEAFLSEWGLPKAVAKALGNEGCYSKVALLGLTDEDIRGFSDLKKGEMAALHSAVGQLQANRGGGPFTPKTATPAPSQRLSMLLHDLLKMNADKVDISARATARVDLDPHFYLQNASGEAKPHLITDFVSDIVTDTGNLTGTRGYMDTE